MKVPGFPTLPGLPDTSKNIVFTKVFQGSKPTTLFFSELLLRVRAKHMSPIPAKSSNIIVKDNVCEPHRVLKRIQRIQRIHRKRNIRCETDPGFPTPGLRMTVVYTNSLKLRLCLASRHWLTSSSVAATHKLELQINISAWIFHT